MTTEAGKALGREMLTLGIYRPVILIEDTKELIELIENYTEDTF